MDRIFFYLVISSFLFLTIPTKAQEILPPGGPTPEVSHENDLKSWYVNLGGGLAFPSYSSNSSLQSYSNSEKSAASLNYAINVDIGFYWPFANHLLFGVADTGVTDIYQISSSSSSGSTSISSGYVIMSNLLASLQYFPFSTNFSQWFMRADVGACSVSSTTSSNVLVNTSAGTGLGTHFTIGYSIPIIRETHNVRIPISLGYFNESIPSGTVTALALTGSVMF